MPFVTAVNIKVLRRSSEAPLLMPGYRKPVKLQLNRLPPIEDRLHDFRRKQREPESAADVGRSQSLGMGQIL